MGTDRPAAAFEERQRLPTGERQPPLLRGHDVDGADRFAIAPPAGRVWQVERVFRRYRRWVETGGFDAMLETLAEMAGRERSADMIDSTIVRAHHCAVGIKKGHKRPRRLADRVVGSPRNSTSPATEKAARSASS